MNAAKYILHYICFAECMLPNTFCIIYVLRNECCQICFGLYMFCGINAAKYVLDYICSAECMLPDTFWIKPINLYNSYKKREDQLS